MTTMVERVAEAIIAALPPGAIEAMPYEAVWDFAPAARAAIAAMREPTDAMVDNFYEQFLPDSPWGTMEVGWRAMIDAALAPEEPKG